MPRLINCSSYTKSNSPWIPTDAITALVVKELDYVDQSGARVATDWVAAVGGRTYAGNPAGVGLWHVNYANGVDYQDQTSMPDDTGLGINQPISVEAALALDQNGFPEIQVLVGSRFERDSGYQPLTILTKPTDDATSPLFLRAEPIPTPWNAIDNLWVPYGDVKSIKHNPNSGSLANYYICGRCITCDCLWRFPRSPYRLYGELYLSRLKPKTDSD